MKTVIQSIARFVATAAAVACGVWLGNKTSQQQPQAWEYRVDTVSMPSGGDWRAMDWYNAAMSRNGNSGEELVAFVQELDGAHAVFRSQHDRCPDAVVNAEVDAASKRWLAETN